MLIKKDATGRDSYLTIQALFYAIHFIDGLPHPYHESSNRDDMVRLLRAKLGADSFEQRAALLGPFLEEATGRPLNVETEAVSEPESAW